MKAEWSELRLALRRVLQVALDYCVQEGTLHESNKQFYLMSGMKKIAKI